MSRKDPLALLNTRRPRTVAQDAMLAEACRRVLREYRVAVSRGPAPAALLKRARQALIHLGGDPTRPGASLRDYDHRRYGPFLGVSDEGSAAAEIREAAWSSPKVRALRKSEVSPLTVGVAVDAERLGGIGEVAVGPNEYADVYLECVGRLLVTTNIGTRVNMRVYRREPEIRLLRMDAAALGKARKEIAAAFKPFVETPDGEPRPLTVFLRLPRKSRMSAAAKRNALEELRKFVASGEAAGRKRVPAGQRIGLSASVRSGKAGRDEALGAIALAESAGVEVVILEGIKRKVADRSVSLAGLLDYFAPGLVGPILRRAGQSVQVRTANLPDTDTIARSTWAGLSVARSYGAHLGKYGCFPMTRLETDAVVADVQKWFRDWSAAPVFFVDQGLLSENQVDVGRDIMRGLKSWLRTVAARGVKVVLIDTIDKPSGKRLLKADSKDRDGFLGPNQVKTIEALARELRVKVLWAGGLGLNDAYKMGKLGVFGIYVTSAAATTIPVPHTYVRDPALAGVKEPSREAVFRVKVLLEAGFLSERLRGSLATQLETAAGRAMAAHAAHDADGTQLQFVTLASLCTEAWRKFWRR